MNRPVKAALALSALICTAAAIPAMTSAHHGFFMEYGTDTAFWIQGEIVDAYFGQPHPEITLRVQKRAMPPKGFTAENAQDLLQKIDSVPRDITRTAQIDFPQQRPFFELDRSIKEGDVVAVIVLRGCEEPRPLRAQWILLPDGASIRAKGKVQLETDRCSKLPQRIDN